MFTNNSSPFSGLVSVILVLVLIGAFAALALSGSDLTNFMTNRAKAQAMTQQNEIDAQKARIDLENYKNIQNSQAKVEQDKLQADAEAYKQSLDQQLLHQQQQNDLALQLQAQKALQQAQTSHLAGTILAGAGAFALLVLSLGVAAWLIQFGYSRYLVARSSATVNDPWQNVAWRKQQVYLSRQREKEFRAISRSAKTQVRIFPHPNSTYRKQQNQNNKDLPLAG